MTSYADRRERSPYPMVLGAVGIGFVLGGGLFTRLTATIVGAGVRIGLMAALPLLKEELAAAFTESKWTSTKESER